jgi:diguanylate cyclase (GGDEF)-like protein/PAS domain S-box-containing protein
MINIHVLLRLPSCIFAYKTFCNTSFRRFLLPSFISLLSFLSFVSYAESSFQEIFKKHSAIMLIIEPSTGEIIESNLSAKLFYRFPTSPLKPLFIQDINLLSKEQVAKERALAKAENRNFFIFRHKVANEEIKTVAVYSVPIIYKKQNVLFSVIQDITSEREFKQELWHYQTNLETLVDKQVNELDENKKQRIKTLLVSILFLVILVLFLIYLLKRKKVIEEQRGVLSQIVEQSPVSIETTDIEGVITYVNQRFIESTGFNGYELVGKKPSILKSGYHNSQLYDDLWKTISSGNPWVGELYNKKKNGERFWEKANIYPLKNVKNEISSYVAIKEDITQTKEDEKQLRLASTVFKTATEAVMVTDADNLIVAVNKAFTVITGYAESDVLGRKPTLLSSGNHEEDFYKNMTTELALSGTWQGEICNRRKSGEVYYEWLSITAIRDKLGQLESYVSLFSDITIRKKAEDKIYHQANYDSLTGLANRNLFIDRVEQSLELSKRDNNSIAVLFIDLDGFKNINDTFGHSKGDMLLKSAAERIQSSVRATDTVARLSGDEFAIMLRSDNDVYSNEKVATKILKSLALPYQLKEKEAHVSASIGIAIYPDDGQSSEELLIKADSAMYMAKEKGKNNVQFFTKEMDSKAQLRRSLEVELRKTIINNELVLHYQPIHNVETREVVAAEALIRWNHPKRGLISPVDFIPLAEDIGFIVNIGDWVLKQACTQAKSWQNQCKNSPKVSVNISSLQLNCHDFIDKLKLVLEQTKLCPSLLTLEITESLLIEKDDTTLTKLQKIRGLGVDLSIDDFGTGYSSLSYLKRFPINILKIDRAFIKDILVNSEDEALTCAILSIANSLSLNVVAEGVENEAQFELLAKHGCQFAQGYLFSKPVENLIFEEYLQDKDKDKDESCQ